MLTFLMPRNGDTVQYDVVYLKADWKPDLKQTAKNWKVIKETESKSIMFMRNGASQKSSESWSPEGYGADSM